jgi:hypothetical protein
VPDLRNTEREPKVFVYEGFTGDRLQSILEAQQLESCLSVGSEGQSGTDFFELRGGFVYTEVNGRARLFGFEDPKCDAKSSYACGSGMSLPKRCSMVQNLPPPITAILRGDIDMVKRLSEDGQNVCRGR